MPNTGMLDHCAFKPKSENRSKSVVHWMESWPSTSGYQTVRQTHRINGFSRYFHSQIQFQRQLTQSMSRPGSSTQRQAMGNSISPFHTGIKPTCGYFFSRETDNRKRNISIPPSNLVAWRSSRGNSAFVRPNRAGTA